MADRYYRFFCVSYLGREEIIKKAEGYAEHYAISPFHDKDKKEDGTPKEPHHHIILTFTSNKSIQSVRNYFEKNTNQTFLAKPLEDLQEAYNYLSHKNTENKYRYDENDIITDKSEYWNKVKDDKDNTGTNDEFVDDLLADDFSLEKMGRKYGRDFIKNHKNYWQYRNQVIRERNGILGVLETDMQLIEALKKQYPWYF